MDKKEGASSFPDHNQNCWQLSSIQGASLASLPTLIGSQIAAQFGIGSAISSVIIGNLILWMVGFTIISMAAPERNNAIENVKRYLGKTAGMLAALFLILSFIAWYILQINSAMIAMSHLIHFEGGQLRWGAAVGVLVALLSIGGIHFIKHFSVVVFPFLFCFIFYITVKSLPSFYVDTFWEFSFVGTIAILAVNLPGMVNLPTFFRHSRSHVDSYCGLSLMVLFTIFFQLSTIVMGFSTTTAIHPSNPIDLMMWIVFLLLSMIAVNLVNIYFASAGWEMILPHRRSAKEYAIVGLIGTTAYTFLQISEPMQFLENMAENFIASLGVILMMAFLVKIVVRHRPRPLEQLINISCWLFGGVIGTIIQAQSNIDPTRVLIMAMTSSLIAFLFVIFLEETIWAFKKAIKP